MSKFEFVSGYADAGLHLPSRATANAAGYDFEVAEDIVIPSYWFLIDKIKTYSGFNNQSLTLDGAANVIKVAAAKPTLVPTGVKCQLKPFEYLELSVRSSLPLKHWLILANGVGIVDSDYYNNESNEGHIYFQLINLAPFDIQLKKGDRIGQGIIRSYDLVDGDEYNKGASRTGGFGSTQYVNELSEDEHQKILQEIKQMNTSSKIGPIGPISNVEFINTISPTVDTSYIINEDKINTDQMTFNDILNMSFEE